MASSELKQDTNTPNTTELTPYTVYKDSNIHNFHSTSPNGSTRETIASNSNSNRRRVFAFQKRWLHSLPIIEKTLTEDELTTYTNATNPSNVINEIAPPYKVVACMVCDSFTPHQSALKVWSRSNCRRGRIENHLLNKHPEFMLLLKQKREVEGELAVQLFLENMRHGKCDYRSEITARLYNQKVPIAPSPIIQNQIQKVKGVSCYDTEKESSLQGYADSKSSDLVLCEVIPHNCRDNAGRNYDLRDGVQRKKAKLDLKQSLDANSIKTILIVGEGLLIENLAVQLWLLGFQILLTFRCVKRKKKFLSAHQSLINSSSDQQPFLLFTCEFGNKSDIQKWVGELCEKTEIVRYFLHYSAYESCNLGELFEVEILVRTKLLKHFGSKIVYIVPFSEELRCRIHCAAVEAISHTLTEEWATEAVQVHCICIDSALLDNIKEASFAQHSESSDIVGRKRSVVPSLWDIIIYILHPKFEAATGNVFRLRKDNIAKTGIDKADLSDSIV